MTTATAALPVDAPPSTAPAPAPTPAADAPPASAWPTPPPCVPVIQEGDAFILDINGDRQALMRARKDG